MEINLGELYFEIFVICVNNILIFEKIPYIIFFVKIFNSTLKFEQNVILYTLLIKFKFKVTVKLSCNV